MLQLKKIIELDIYNFKTASHLKIYILYCTLREKAKDRKSDYSLSPKGILTHHFDGMRRCVLTVGEYTLISSCC